MKKISICFFVLAIMVMSIPSVNSVVTAQEITGIAQLSGCTGLDCSACNVVDMANGGIKWLIGILFVVFALLMAIAGVKLVTSGGNHHALDEAKSSFTNAIIGFMIILSAWLVVDTIMRALVGTNGREGQIGQIGANGRVSGWLFWSEVSCQEQTKPNLKIVVQKEVVEISPPETLIDQGTGNAGRITVPTPSGSQVVDVSACDTSNLTTVNAFGASVTIHKQFAASLQRVDAAWRAQGGSRSYNVYSIGGYNCRKISGSSKWSNHAYGVAIDINPDKNPYGPNLVTDMPPAFRQIFLNEGWGWGGNWNSVKDAMHFSKASGEGGNMSGG